MGAEQQRLRARVPARDPDEEIARVAPDAPVDVVLPDRQPEGLQNADDVIGAGPLPPGWARDRAERRELLPQQQLLARIRATGEPRGPRRALRRAVPERQRALVGGVAQRSAGVAVSCWISRRSCARWCAVLTKPTKIGDGRSGRLLNSGCAWAATKNG